METSGRMKHSPYDTRDFDLSISRFIGELYKLGMLTARIMHECVRKLLNSNPSDEESLECLCRLADWSSGRQLSLINFSSRLLTTVGQDLDKETTERLNKGSVQGLCDLTSYFKVSFSRLIWSTL